VSEPRVQPRPAQGTPDRSRDWERLRHLTELARSGGLGLLSEADLWELPGLYRKAISDLSLLRSRGESPYVLQELNALCNRAHAVIYRDTLQRRGPGIAAYILYELPRAVRRQARIVLAAAAVLLFFAALGWLHCALQPGLAQRVLGPQLVGSVESSLRAARHDADLGLAAQIPLPVRSTAALAITFNNIGVSVRAFVWGLAGGLPTLLLLGFNGYMLGAIGFLYFNTTPGIAVNLPLYFIAGIAPHGSIELPAICLASAAGMLIGFAWLFPGQRTRGEALRAAAHDAGRLVIACALTLVVAGCLEGYVTPLLPPKGFPVEAWYWLKIATGVLVFSTWLLWLSLGGRRAESAAGE
jgi:uncharacterized membrane protein SpoIIM required for sporulation